MRFLPKKLCELVPSVCVCVCARQIDVILIYLFGKLTLYFQSVGRERPMLIWIVDCTFIYSTVRFCLFVFIIAG